MLKIIIIYLLRVLNRSLYIFPIKKYRVIAYSYSGDFYNDNPKYITEYLLLHDKRYEIIWALKRKNEAKKVPSCCKVVKYGSLKFVYYQLTSHYVITNTGVFKPVSKRKGQEIINTWHGGGAYKKTGADVPYKNKWKRFYAEHLGQKDITVFLTSSRAFTQYCIRGAFGYKGKVIESGMPRNDLFVDRTYKEKIESINNKLGISENTAIILYAPTWKNYSMEKYEKLDYKRIINLVHQKTGNKCLLLVRAHHFSNPNIEYKEGNIINVSDYDDMQELLIIADILISDYSSCIWDFLLLNKPCILYIPDVEMYNKNFSFYSDIDTWGGYICNNNNEVENTILGLSESETIKKIKLNHELYGNLETGKARKMVFDLMEKQL